MEQKEYVYETQNRPYGRGSYQVRRVAKWVCCLDCGMRWLMRKDRKPPSYCRECAVKGTRNPSYGKPSWNAGTGTSDRKVYARNYCNRARWEKKKALIRHMGNECAMCGQKNLPLCVWQWHHVDPKEKVKALSQMLIGKLEDLYEECKKCVLLCSNCHKIYHYGDERLENG